MKKYITYNKIFLSGLLVGLLVPCSYEVTDDKTVHEQCLKLMSMTKDAPGSDCVTGAKFYTSNVGTCEYAPGPRFTEVSNIQEYGLTQKLSNPIRVF